jgi:hypothetical protein
VYWCVVVDGFPNLDEVRRVKDFRFNKILGDGQFESDKLEVAPTVMMSVFEGGDGWTSGGRSERSRESGDLDREEARDRCGEGISVLILLI